MNTALAEAEQQVQSKQAAADLFFPLRLFGCGGKHTATANGEQPAAGLVCPLKRVNKNQQQQKCRAKAAAFLVRCVPFGVGGGR